MLELRRFDPSRYLRSSEEIQDFLTVAAEGNDPHHLATARRIAQRAERRLQSAEPSKKTSASRSNRRPKN